MSSDIPDSVQAVLANADCAGPASEELITGVERRLGLRFPKEYRTFLSRFGAALCNGFEVYGLVDAPDAGEPPIWSDLRGSLRKRVERSLEMSLLPISDDGGDYKFYLTTGAASGGVVVYGPGLDGVEVAKNFFDFLTRANEEGISSLVPQ